MTATAFDELDESQEYTFPSHSVYQGFLRGWGSETGRKTLRFEGTYLSESYLYRTML